ncbi:MAG: ABC transporter ATP-binding protein, partial [Desulfobulbaceae bacterium]
QDLHFFLHGQPSTPEFYREEKKEEVKAPQAGSADADAQKVPRTPAADRESSEPESFQEGGTEADSSLDSGATGTANNVLATGSGTPGKPEKAAGVIQEPVVVDKEEPDERVRWVDSVTGTEEARVPSVILENVILNYRRTASFALFSPNKRLGKATDFLAIDHVSFTIYENETVGIIGRNGSGKSTISMIISGALPPDAGRVKVNGKVQLLALGVGFRPELTGRENVYISGTLLGMTRRQVTARIGDIEEFAELGEFFDEPLRIYSSGMRSRLGFAVATAVNPDILILDEVMSTGDAAFRNKADQRMQAMRQRTKTVLMVSHSAEQVKNLCSRVVWLEKGRLIMDGPAVPILAEYNKFCKNPGKWLENHRQP